MSTLAEQFHDSFDPYYAGKKAGWGDKKTSPRPEAVKQEQAQQGPATESQQLLAESRH